MEGRTRKHTGSLSSFACCADFGIHYNIFFHIYWLTFQAGVVANAYSPSSWETEAGGFLQVWSQPGPQCETLFQKPKIQQNRHYESSMVSLNWQWGDLCRHERGLCHSRRQEFYSCRHHECGVQWFFPTYRWRNVPLVEHGQLMPLQFAFSQGWSSQSTTYPFTLLPSILLELQQVRKPSCKQQTVKMISYWPYEKQASQENQLSAS